MISLEVNGVDYEGWTDITITKSWEDLSGTFTFTTVSSETVDFPVKVGQSCRIKVEETTVITGFIEQVEVSYTNNTHSINVRGRDRTCDVIDSTLKDDITFTAPITLEQITEKVLELIGATEIAVSSNTYLTPFQDGELESGEAGISAFDLIEKYAKKKHVLMTTTGDGNIRFIRSDIGGISALTNKYNTVLSLTEKTDSTILSAIATYDNTKRFYKYVAFSQENDSVQYYETDNKKSTNILDQAIDPEIRSTRLYNFAAEQALLDNTQATTRAQWEANYRRSQSFIYNCVVQGFTPINDEIIWQPGYLCEIIDSFSDINSTLLISNVEFSLSLGEGSKTTIKFVTQDSFTLQVEKPEKKKSEQPEMTIYFEPAPASKNNAT